MDAYKKKYRNALKKAEAFYYSATTEPITEREVLANIFPELQESADDKIREEIISALKWANHKGVYDKHIAWLEKQGNKPFDYENANIRQKDFAPRVEPKFKIGDLVVYDHHFSKIKDVDSKDYFVEDTYGDEGVIPIEFAESHYHLWTIQDEKDGDVLQLGAVTAIFKEYIGNVYCKCYCSICNGEFEIPSQDGADNSYGCHNATPATKEQCDTLIKAMTDAGYTFDYEKKELKKIEQKPNWSEEDERMLNHIIGYLHSGDDFQTGIDWLKSIKDRIQPQPKQEWSELDERNLQGIIDEIEANKSEAPDYDIKTYDRFLSWLESLKERIGG